MRTRQLPSFGEVGGGTNTPTMSKNNTFLLRFLVPLLLPCSLLFSALLFVAACHPPQAAAKPDAGAEPLCRVWLHSREEDKAGNKTYRPADASFTFPPARGRYGLVFAKDGTGNLTYPGPTDATEKKAFKWTLKKDKTEQLLRIDYPAGSDRPNESYHLVTLTADILLLKPL